MYLMLAGLAPKDVDIIVTTCSIFCPTPSLASMVVNHFGMRTDVQSYHLGGMGCSNGVVAVNLVKDLLRVSISVSTIRITQSYISTHTACTGLCWYGNSSLVHCSSHSSNLVAVHCWKFFVLG
jgi:predicted naringenin-chalcone synthase